MKTLDHIKSGLLQRAKSRLGEPNHEQDAFINWMAHELYALYRELANSQDYVKSSILNRIRPDVASRPVPVHALAHTSPRNTDQVLNPDDTTFIARRPGNQQPNEIYFTPLRSVRLTPASVKWRCFDRTLEETLDGQMMQPYDQAIPGHSIHPGVMWIGIKLMEGVEPPKQLTFHLELGTDDYEQQPTPSLHLIQWEHEAVKLKTGLGMKPMIKQNPRNHSQTLDIEYLHLHAMEKKIIANYDPQFICIEHPERLRPSEIPNEIRDNFEEETLKALDSQSHIWLKLIFPHGFSEADIGRLKVRLNCFPIINRKLDKIKDFDPSRDGMVEIIPLCNEDSRRSDLVSSGDYFLGMESIQSRKTTYRAVTFEHFRQVHQGYYALQHGRVEANDFRDMLHRAMELISLIKESEARLKQSAGHEIQDALDQLKSSCDNIQAELQTIPAQAFDPGYYLHLKPIDSYDKIYVRFWLSQGPAATGILSAGDMLEGEGAADLAWVIGHSIS